MEDDATFSFCEGKTLSNEQLVFALKSGSHFNTAMSLLCLTSRAILRIDRSPAFGEQTMHSHMIAIELCNESRRWSFDLCEGNGWQSSYIFFDDLRTVMTGAISVVICMPNIKPTQ